MEVAGMCVPSGGGSGDDVECGPGTVASEGLCVPDGSLLCDQGTTYDATSGQCVVDPAACAAGTVLLGGVCVPEDDALTADHEEAAEPNDDDGAGEFEMPALGESTTLHGCITPRDGEGDRDYWLITTAEPALVEITADGVGGLAAAFIVIADDVAGLTGYQRYGISATSDTARRQVYLPAAGRYGLFFFDARELLIGEVFGGAGTCYYTTVTHVALPAATPLTLPVTAGTDDGNVDVYSFTPGSGGEILDIRGDAANAQSQAVSGAFVVRRNGAFVRAARELDDGGGARLPPAATLGGLVATDELEIIIDNEYVIGVGPVAYELHSVRVEALPLPTNGSTLVVTKHNGDHPSRPHLDNNFFSLDVEAGEVIRFDVESSASTSMHVVRSSILRNDGRGDYVASFTEADGNGAPSSRMSVDGLYVHFKVAGRYYFATRDPAGASGATYTVQATLSRVMPSALTYGVQADDVALPASGAAFHTLDLDDTENWIELAVAGGTGWNGNARVVLYDLGQEGWLAMQDGELGANVPFLQLGTQPGDGLSPMGRIVAGEGRDYLVRVEPTAMPGASPVFDIIARERPHVALTVGTAAIERTESIAAGRGQNYLLFGMSGYRLDAMATPALNTVDVAIARLDARETAQGIDELGPGGSESHTPVWTLTPPWIALRVTHDAATTSDVDVVFGATPPLPYVEICSSGTTLLSKVDDNYSAVQTLPNDFGFEYFGAAQTQFVIGANGFLAFGGTAPTCTFGCFSNGTIPSTAQPQGGLLAPYWDDLFDVTVCRKDEADTVAVQWTGTGVQFQVVLHADGQIDFIYGPQHTANGGSATVGYESPDGLTGRQFSRNQAGSVVPSSSRSFTTAP